MKLQGNFWQSKVMQGTLPTDLDMVRSCTQVSQPFLLQGLGIGLEVHEDPYLHGGSAVVIESGHTFSNEPGIYIEGQVSGKHISFSRG